MIDIQETKKVNNAMIEIIKQSVTDPRIMLSIEGYMVTSDSSQNPHTSLDIYLERMDLKGYLTIGEILNKEFDIDYLIESFILPADHDVHERLRLAIQIVKKKEVSRL